MKGIKTITKKKRFDWHEWQAPTYEEPEDILRALSELDVLGKYIARVDVIGFSSNPAELSARRAQHNAGIPYSVKDKGEFIYSNQTLVPCSIKIMESVIITFTDGSSLELQAIGNQYLKIIRDKIDKKILNGTNNSNIYANKLFKKLTGAQLKDFNVNTFTRENTHAGNFHKEISQYIIYQFWTWNNNDNLGFSITHHGGAWYSLELRKQNYFTYECNEIEPVKYSSFIKNFKDKRQILIIERHDSSSYFWINPVKITDKANKYGEYVEEHVAEEISIEEENVLEFLYYFLEKYFQPKIQVRDECDNPEFEWYLTHNIYTYDSVTTIISEIREISKLFRADFDNPKLDVVKKQFSPYMLSNSEIRKSLSELSDNEKNEIYRANIDFVLDFYDRFCLRMELMMKHSPQYNLISFMGP
jgi:hypothetical protein